MGRNIVLLSDGTGNSAAKVWRTNVWRTFEALDLAGSDQMAFYDDGVGTSSFKPLAILGGAFGFGLKRNVIDIYKFACRNYRTEDDEIYSFGFSRGGFTIRIVAGLMLNQGLVAADNEAELDRRAHQAYRQYRRERFHTLWRVEDIFRTIRDWFLRKDYDKRNNRQLRRIRFLGVWDTVAAYGLPLDEMTRGVSKFIVPLELPDHTLNRERVARACQALALDEERTTFHPELWDERIDPPVAFDPGAKRFIRDEQISQVWFAGVHSNVGGGYPDDSLAYVPFVWMITEAQRCGLIFKSDHGRPPADPDTFKNAISRRDKDGRLYDSRAGLGSYYRYGPRKLAELCNEVFSRKRGDAVFVARPKIHESAFRRIGNRAHAYAPPGLPAVYDVVTDDGAILTPDQYGFETNAIAAARAESQEHVWNGIWKRRLVYFATVGATLWLVVFPLVSGARRVDEFYSPIRWVSDIIRFVGGFLPGFAKTWVSGFARAPGWFIALSTLVIVLMLWGTSIASRISNRMGEIWNGAPSAPVGLPGGLVYRLRTNAIYVATREAIKRTIAPAFFALFFAYAGISLASHFAYNAQDVAGFTCNDNSTDPAILAPKPLDASGDMASVIFNTADLCKATGILLERGKQYSVKIEPDVAWTDSGIPVALGGFSAKDPPLWYHRILLSLGLPLRRELTEDWFRVVLRYGRVGGEERFLEPDPDDSVLEASIKPTRDGELFVFVNDAVVGIPGLYDLLYRNNQGSAKLVVKRK
jgi:uncharacterized protein (DUF2235 family)